ncbi:MAG: energy transducer TonB, partial [Candidatus Neomarinimicrobiota bacterium]
MSPDKDLLNEGYPLRIRLIVTGLVLVLAVIALTFPRFTSRIRFNPQSFEEVVETFDIPPTRQFEAPPPPARPSIPVESENENLAEDITIEETELENFEWEAPPPPPIEEGPV